MRLLLVLHFGGHDLGLEFVMPKSHAINRFKNSAELGA